MNPLEFEQEGARYRIKRLNVKEQWNLTRKISPLLPPLAPVFMKIASAGGVSNDVSGIAELLGPFTESIAGMTDEASAFVIDTCMGAIQREVSANVWMPVWTSAGISTFPELNDLSKVIPMVIKVVWDALGPFIRGFLSAQEPTAKAE